MVPRLFGPKADLTLELDKKTYVPGDPVEVKVTLTTDKDMVIEEGYVELTCKGRHERRTVRPMTDSYSSGGIPVDLYRSRSVFAPRSTIPGGVPQSYKVTFNIPADAPPSHGTARAEWRVKAVCDVRRGRDITREMQFAVRAQTD